MGAAVTKEDFVWHYTEEPHATRRRQIVAAHPDVKSLFGIDRSFNYVVSAIVITQVIVAYCLKDSDWTLVVLQAYFTAGTFNHAIVLAEHEISHNMCFGNNYPLANRLFGIWANLPIGLPLSISFKKYHVEHHRYLGVEGLDTDLPTEAEAWFFSNALGKLTWLFLQPAFYALRPFFVYRKAITDLEVLNTIVQLSFDFCIWYFFGIKSLAYFLIGTVLGLGIHPSAGHFVSDHYIFSSETQETSSYYGPLNMVTFNVGYHNEHHDFPFVAGSNLPKIRAMAPEFYDTLHVHDSWLALMWRFVFDPTVGLRSRSKRPKEADTQYYHFTCHVAKFVEKTLSFVTTRKHVD